MNNLPILEDHWFEVWFTQGDNLIPTWLLIVIPDLENPGKVLICDPLANNKVVFLADDYEKATDWLVEDEYELVEGRQFEIDYWEIRIREKRNRESTD